MSISPYNRSDLNNINSNETKALPPAQEKSGWLSTTVSAIFNVIPNGFSRNPSECPPLRPSGQSLPQAFPSVLTNSSSSSSTTGLPHSTSSSSSSTVTAPVSARSSNVPMASEDYNEGDYEGFYHSTYMNAVENVKYQEDMFPAQQLKCAYNSLMPYIGIVGNSSEIQEYFSECATFEDVWSKAHNEFARINPWQFIVPLVKDLATTLLQKQLEHEIQKSLRDRPDAQENVHGQRFADFLYSDLNPLIYNNPLHPSIQGSRHSYIPLLQSSDIIKEYVKGHYNGDLGSLTRNIRARVGKQGLADSVILYLEKRHKQFQKTIPHSYTTSNSSSTSSSSSSTRNEAKAAPQLIGCIVTPQALASFNASMANWNPLTLQPTHRGMLSAPEGKLCDRVDEKRRWSTLCSNQDEKAIERVARDQNDPLALAAANLLLDRFNLRGDSRKNIFKDLVNVYQLTPLKYYQEMDLR